MKKKLTLEDIISKNSRSEDKGKTRQRGTKLLKPQKAHPTGASLFSWYKINGRHNMIGTNLFDRLQLCNSRRKLKFEWIKFSSQ